MSKTAVCICRHCSFWFASTGGLCSHSAFLFFPVQDVEMQIYCREWASKYNEYQPPKHVEFIQVRKGSD